MQQSFSYQHRVQVLAGNHAVGARVRGLPDELLVPGHGHISGLEHLLHSISNLGADACTTKQEATVSNAAGCLYTALRYCCCFRTIAGEESSSESLGGVVCHLLSTECWGSRGEGGAQQIG